MGIIGKLFRRNRGDPGNPGFDRGKSGRYHAAYQQTRQPTPGAMSYAYETLGLVQFAPSGPSVTVRKPQRLENPQLYALQGVTAAGIPTTANGIIGAPLFDPISGWQKGYGIADAFGRVLNVPSPAPYTIGTNDPNPARAKGAP